MSAKKTYLILSLIIFISGICSTSLAKSASRDKSAGSKIVIEYEFSAPVVTNRDGYNYVQIDQTQSYERTGAPIVPVRPANILIPFGRKVASCTVTAMDTQQLDGSYTLAPAQERYPLSYKGKIERTPPDPAIYGQANPWPKAGHEKMDTQSKRGYQIFTVNLFPLQYIPSTGQITYSAKLRLEINLAADPAASHMVRPSKEAKSKLEKLVDNSDTALETYSSAESSMQGIEAVTESLPSGGPYQYVIITNAALEAAPGPWNFQALRDAKIANGMTATIVTTEWIYANYSGTKPSGGSDDQTKIRNFLIDAYQNWGTQYVLLGGTNAIIPARLFYVGYTGSDTGYMPVDMYYGCVEPSTCTFDYDADNKYGESTDGVGGGDVDLYAEIYVGRAPVSNALEVENFIRKTLTYDISSGDYILRAAMLGEYLGFGGVSNYATDMMEQIRLGGTYDGYFTYGFENHPQSASFDFDTTGCLPGNPSSCWPLYDSDTYDWTPDELLALMNGGIHIFNHDGHANYTYDMKLYRSDLVELANTDYFFVYSQGCMPGGFDTPNCFAETITSMEHGAFAVIMNARFGWGTGGSTDGPSHRYARQFWDAVLGEQILEIGRANQDSKEENLWDISDQVIRFCYYELTLFGDPQQQFRFQQLPLTISNTDNAGDCTGSGSQITYTIGYNYAGTGGLPDITNVSIIDELPLEADFVSASGGGVYNAGSHTVTWTIGTLHPSDSGNFTVTVIVNSPQPGSKLINYCELSSGAQILKRLDNSVRICWPQDYIIYVDSTATGANDGTSWSNAYVNLQDALYKLTLSLPSSSENVQVWAAGGTYKPDKGVDQALSDMQAAFCLINNVSIYGGFAPGGCTWQNRNPAIYETIISGDIGTVGNIDDNTNHVVFGSRKNQTAVLDGVTISGGNASTKGGGMYNVSGSPTVNNCKFTNNRAPIGAGMYNEASNPVVTNCSFISNSAWTDREDIPYTYSGGMDNYYGSSPVVTNCIFSGNSSYSDFSGDGYGAAMSNYTNCNPTVTDCTFTSNQAMNAIYCFSSSPKITNCAFIANQASGIMNDSSGATIANCTFIGNSYVWGGGVYNYGGTVKIVNCTFSGNSATSYGGGIFNQYSNPTISNCILWSNTSPSGPQIYNSGTSSPAVTYCDVQGGWSGTGNVNTNPLFVDVDGTDNILGNMDDDVRLSSGSTCVDAASNSAVPSGITTDLDGNPRFCDAPAADTGEGSPPIVDMGAYEYFFASDAASNPSPANGAANISTTADLSWTAGTGATSHDVYFGTDSTPDSGEFIGNQAGTTYDPGTLSYNTTYYWRIDEHNAGGTTAGAVWSFTTVLPPDTTAPTPNPLVWVTVPTATGQTAITMTAATAADDTPPVQYYFECTNDGGKSSTWQTSTTYVASGLTPSTQYSFRVKARDSAPALNETDWSSTQSATTLAPQVTFVAAGTAVSGTGAITVAWPAHQAGDVALLFVESCGGQAANLSTPAGFAAVASSPQSTGTTTSGTRLTVYWCRATSSSMTSPVVTDPGDHAYGRILTFRGVVAAGNPWDITAGGIKSTASTTTTFGAVTTSVDNDMIILAASRDNDSSSAAWSNWSNANLSSLTERSDGGTSSGNGGGLGIATGVKASAGNTGSTTATVTSSVDGHMTIALKPEGGIVSPPGSASNPAPANGQTDVSVTQDLSWTAGSGATSHDVYFGTVNPPPFIGNQSGTTFDTGTMNSTTTYYWRIDEKNAGGTTVGAVWSFTTASPPPPPGAASNPSPANGATSVSTTADLSWTAGSGATSHDVYFGTVNPPPFIGNQSGTTFDTGTMNSSTTYYWRIDEKNAGGTTTGTVWNFTTAAVVVTPAFVAAGTAASGTGNITVSWPTHQAGDVALLFVESCGGQAANFSTPAGFAAVTNSPQSTGTTTYGTRLTVYWCRATSSSMASPVVTDPGNHVYGRILTFRNVTATGNPWDITAGGVKATASTTTTFGAVTTSVNNTLIVLAAARDNDSSSAAWSNWSNANLSSLTERSDGGTTSGNGGGLGIATGVKSTAGSTGNTTAMVTSSVDGHITIALKP